MKAGLFLATALLTPAILGCTHTIKVEPIEVKPIFITVDVRVRLEDELDDFFDYQGETAPSSATQPENNS